MLNIGYMLTDALCDLQRIENDRGAWSLDQEVEIPPRPWMIDLRIGKVIEISPHPDPGNNLYVVVSLDVPGDTKLMLPFNRIMIIAYLCTPPRVQGVIHGLCHRRVVHLIQRKRRIVVDCQ